MADITTLSTNANLATTVLKVNELVAAHNALNAKVALMNNEFGADPAPAEAPEVPDGLFTKSGIDYGFTAATFKFNGQTWDAATLLANKNETETSAFLTELVAAHYNAEEEFEPGILFID